LGVRIPESQNKKHTNNVQKSRFIDELYGGNENVK